MENEKFRRLCERRFSSARFSLRNWRKSRRFPFNSASRLYNEGRMGETASRLTLGGRESARERERGEQRIQRRNLEDDLRYDRVRKP